MPVVTRKRKVARALRGSSPAAGHESWDSKEARPRTALRLLEYSALGLVGMLFLGLLLYASPWSFVREKVEPSKTLLTLSPSPPDSAQESARLAVAAVDQFLLRPAQQRFSSVAIPPSSEVQRQALLDWSAPSEMRNPKTSAFRFHNRDLLLVSFHDGNGRLWSAPVEWIEGSYLLHWQAMTAAGDTSWSNVLAGDHKSSIRLRANLTRYSQILKAPGGYEWALLEHPSSSEPKTILLPLESDFSQLPLSDTFPIYAQFDFKEFEGKKYLRATSLIHLNWLQ